METKFVVLISCSGDCSMFNWFHRLIAPFITRISRARPKFIERSYKYHKQTFVFHWFLFIFIFIFNVLLLLIVARRMHAIAVASDDYFIFVFSFCYSELSIKSFCFHYLSVRLLWIQLITIGIWDSKLN